MAMIYDQGIENVIKEALGLANNVLRATKIVSQDPSVKVFDVVEVSPPLDVFDLTANVAAGIVFQFMGGIAKKKSLKR